MSALSDLADAIVTVTRLAEKVDDISKRRDLIQAQLDQANINLDSAKAQLDAAARAGSALIAADPFAAYHAPTP